MSQLDPNLPRADADAFRRIFELMGEGVMVYTQGILQYINPTGRKMAAVDSSEPMIGRPITDFIAPAQRPKIAEALQSAESGRAPVLQEQQFRRWDGEELVLELASVPVLFEEKESRLALFRDVTPRKITERALRESETYLKLILSRFPGLVWSVDHDLRILSCLGTAQERHHLRPGQLIGRTLQEIYPENSPEVKEEIASHLRALSGEIVEWRSLRGTHTYETRLEPLIDETGIITGVLAVSRDISAAAHDEEALRTSESRLRALAHLSPVGLFRVDSRSVCTFVNEHWLQMTGMTAKQVEGRGWMLAIHPEDREQTLRDWNEAMQKGLGFMCEFRLQRPDGKRLWVLGQGLPERGLNGEVENYLGALTDITGRKEAEHLLGIQKSHLAMIAQSLPWDEVTSSLREVLERNVPRGAIVFLGFEDESDRLIVLDSSALMTPIAATLISGYNTEPHHPFRTAALSKSKLKVENLLTSGAWATYPYLHGMRTLVIDPLLSLKGEVLGLCALFLPDSDGQSEWVNRVLETTSYLAGIVLDRKKREEADRNSRELREQNQRILTASRMKSEFLAKMSHELRTPLNAIIGLSELLLDKRPGPLTVRQGEYVSDVLQSGMHLLRLINDVLDLTKIEAGRVELKIEPVTVNEIVNEVCEVLSALAANRGISLDWKSDLHPEEEAQLDASKFRQVLYNLLSNAIKFSPENTGHVEVNIYRNPEDTLVIWVTDNGPGIRLEDREKLFQPFTQLDTTASQNHEGTGLGLAISRQLLELHGGSLTVKSEVGAGARFVATFPKALPKSSVIH